MKIQEARKYFRFRQVNLFNPFDYSTSERDVVFIQNNEDLKAVRLCYEPCKRWGRSETFECITHSPKLPNWFIIDSVDSNTSVRLFESIDDEIFENIEKCYFELKKLKEECEKLE